MAPSSKPRQHHLVLFPLLHNPVARSKAKAKVALMQNKNSG